MNKTTPSITKNIQHLQHLPPKSWKVESQSWEMAVETEVETQSSIVEMQCMPIRIVANPTNRPD